MNSLSYDTPLYVFNGANAPKTGDIGIELELEGELSDPGLGWSYKGEGSLRGGGEYILKRPAPMAQLDKYLTSLRACLEKCKPRISIRCSTHIHVNIGTLTIKEAYYAAFAYYLLEDLLVNTQPKKRQGNLFCLRMSDAEMLEHDIRRSIRKEHYFGIFMPERHRYAALNLCAPMKFGSFEFRFLDAIVDTDVIKMWCELFYNLIHNGKKLPLSDLLTSYDALSPRDFLRTLLPQEAVEYVTKGLTNQDINRLLHVNYDFLYDMKNVFGPGKFQLPQGYWNPDYEPTKRGGKTTFSEAALAYQEAIDAGIGNQVPDQMNLYINTAHQAGNPSPTPTPWGTQTYVLGQATSINDVPDTPEPDDNF